MLYGIFCRFLTQNLNLLYIKIIIGWLHVMDLLQTSSAMKRIKIPILSQTTNLPEDLIKSILMHFILSWIGSFWMCLFNQQGSAMSIVLSAKWSIVLKMIIQRYISQTVVTLLTMILHMYWKNSSIF